MPPETTHLLRPPNAGDEALSEDTLQIGRIGLTSRLILGTGKYKSLELMKQCLEISGTAMVTVAVRRVNLQDRSENSFWNALPKNIQILPNTAGCYNLQDTLRTARLARERCEAYPEGCSTRRYSEGSVCFSEGR